MFLDDVYNGFLAANKANEILETHGIPIGDISSIDKNLRLVLEKALNEEQILKDEALLLTKVSISEVSYLMAVSNYIRKKYKGDLITFSKNIFIPLTQLCRDQCSYCTFKIEPDEGDLLFNQKEFWIRQKKLLSWGVQNCCLYLGIDQKLNMMFIERSSTPWDTILLLIT